MGATRHGPCSSCSPGPGPGPGPGRGRGAGAVTAEGARHRVLGGHVGGSLTSDRRQAREGDVHPRTAAVTANSPARASHVPSVPARVVLDVMRTNGFTRH